MELVKGVLTLMHVAPLLAIGASQNQPVAPSSERHTVHMNITDPLLGSYSRTYYAFVPSQCQKGGSCPLLLWFHGWCDDPLCPGCGWQETGEQNGYVTIMPVGMADGVKGACNSWNIGTGNRSDICIPKDGTDAAVYDSCKKIGLGNPCSLAFTCYDDVHFIEAVVFDAKQRLGIDAQQVYAAGGSNGGEFVYYLAASLALRRESASFKLLGIAPWYGAFMQGTILAPDNLAGIRVAHFHGLRDVTIPPTGGEAFDGFLYAPVNQTLDSYAHVNGCAREPSSLRIPFGEKSENFLGCWSYRLCSRGGLVARCNFDAHHGFWENYSASMTWWFLTVDAALVAPLSPVKFGTELVV